MGVYNSIVYRSLLSFSVIDLVSQMPVTTIVVSCYNDHGQLQLFYRWVCFTTAVMSTEKQ